MPRHEPDFSFYTRSRHREPPEEVIARYCAAQRAVLARLARDLRADRSGPFGESDAALPALAEAADRMQGHVDVLEAVLLNASEDEELAATMRTVVANVVHDGNLAEVAEQRAGAPESAESKFDVKSGGDITESTSDLADKLIDILEAVAESLLPAGHLVAALLRDIGVVGKLSETTTVNLVGKQLEGKLDHLLPVVDRMSGDQSVIRGDVDYLKQIVPRIDGEVNKIEYKVDRLGDLLGRTLVGEPWIVRPTTMSQKVPARSVKDELHDLEDLLRNGNGNGNGHDDGNGNGNGDGDTADGGDGAPADTTDPRLKKIYVYEEDVFAPASANDRRVVRVRTEAFDLSGWLDLSSLRPGDTVETEISVSLAGRPPVLFSAARFDRPGVLSLADLAGGEGRLVGNDLEIVIRQTASADAFATPVELAYQWVVESQ